MKSEITPAELRDLRASGQPFQLVDVREAWEHEMVALPGDVLIPLRTLPARLHELDRSRAVVVYCHHGARSMLAARTLERAGYEATSLAGGIERWATEIDPSMKRY